MNKHKKDDDPDLVDALEHIIYEIWKYRQSVARYAEIQCAGGDAALEFRVLHHRVLLEFFHGPPKHEDNLVAWEYIAGWQQTHARGNVPWVDSYMRRCHTMLAHISKTRSEMAKSGLKSWAGEWQTVEPHLNQTIADFLSALSTNHKAVCLQWITKWLAGSYPGNEVLRGLLDFLQ